MVVNYPRSKQMNTNYINAVTIDLIEKQDFIPIKDNNENYVLNDTLKVLQKGTSQAFRIICLIDGDSLSDIQLEQTLGNNLLWMNNINISGISDELILTEILVFSNKPDASQLSVMDIHKKSNVANNIFFEILVVELDKKNITEYSDSKFSSSDLKLTLSNALFIDLEKFSFLPDIEELINRQPIEPTIPMASNTVPATYILIGVNIAIWLIGQLLLLLFKEDYFTTFGIKDNAAILSGEYWRLVTPIFLHADADIMHISANSFSLLIFGQVIERMLGTKKFLIVYFISGILGNIASFIFSPSDSLGASGAIMGIGGAFIYIWLTNRRAFSGSARQYLTFVFLVFFNLFYGFTRPNIDNFAHFGGFIGGFLSVGSMYKTAKENRLLFTITLIVVILLSIMVGFRGIGF
jgi:rhomboid protease GluP